MREYGRATGRLASSGYLSVAAFLLLLVVWSMPARAVDEVPAGEPGSSSKAPTPEAEKETQEETPPKPPPARKTGRTEKVQPGMAVDFPVDI